jgi:hypothetical protein
MVLATAMSRSAMKVSLETTPLSREMLEKMVSAFFCSRRSMIEASPACHVRPRRLLASTRRHDDIAVMKLVFKAR